MGNKLYATEMAKVLDPKGVLFAGRVISRGDDSDSFDSDDRCPKSKDLEGVLGMESSVVIIDDSVRVWPHNKLNLIVVERQVYWNSKGCINFVTIYVNCCVVQVHFHISYN